MEELRTLLLRADGVEIMQGCHMRLRGRATMSLRPDLWELDIISPRSDSLSILVHAKQLLVEGYDASTLCCGQVEEVYTHSEDGKNIATVILADGADFWSSSVSCSLAAGNSAHDALRALAARCSSPVSLAEIQAQDVKFFRGQTFYGKTVSHVSALAASLRARAFFVRGALHIMSLGVANEMITLTEEDIRNTVAEANGAYVVRLSRMRGFPIGQQVTLPDSAAKYRLLCQSVDADNYQGAWRTELILVNEKQIINDVDWGGGEA